MKLPHRRGMRAFCIAALSFVALSAPVAAQESNSYRAITAKELFEGIMDGSLASWVEDLGERTALSSYIATSYIWGVADNTKGKGWCPVPPLAVQDLAETVLNYLGDLPEARQSEDASVVVAESLSKAYPCKR